MLEWVISLMVLLQSVAPWRANYESVALGIIQGAKDEPIFDGSVEKTIVLDISIAWFESKFDINAIGDHGKSHGLYQTPIELPASSDEQTRFANRMIRQSFKACKHRVIEERLGWYAAGGNDCERGLKESRNRMLKAIYLFHKFSTPKE
jgi:hypothetical protein